jgi:hypothetical protein
MRKPLLLLLVLPSFAVALIMSSPNGQSVSAQRNNQSTTDVLYFSDFSPVPGAYSR